MGSAELSTISKNYSSGQIVINANQIVSGGLIGQSKENHVENNYSLVNISTTSLTTNQWNSVGGLIGAVVNDHISNNYVAGNLDVKTPNINSGQGDLAVGGLVGGQFVQNEYSTIRYNYTVGNIKVYTPMEAYVGGVVSERIRGTISNNYRFNNQNITVDAKYPINCDEGSMGSMQTIWEFVASDWDSSIWDIKTTTHPTLK